MFEISELKAKKLPELQELAKSLRVPKYRSLKKLDLVYQILDYQAANPKAVKAVTVEAVAVEKKVSETTSEKSSSPTSETKQNKPQQREQREKRPPNPRNTNRDNREHGTIATQKTHQKALIEMHLRRLRSSMRNQKQSRGKHQNKNKNPNNKRIIDRNQETKAISQIPRTVIRTTETDTANPILSLMASLKVKESLISCRTAMVSLDQVTIITCPLQMTFMSLNHKFDCLD